jgi:lipopolysaccharide export LptBFGC system permease protein LptF
MMTFRTNPGMLAAFVLLVVGGVLVVLGAQGSPLHIAGMGVLILSSAVYLFSRVYMFLKERRP